LIPNMNKLRDFILFIHVRIASRFSKYLPAFKSRYDWIRNPFVTADVILSHVISKNKAP